MRYYLVGGALRDMLLGRIPHDGDVAFSGGVRAFLRQHPQARKVGRGVGTYLLGGLECIPLRGGTVAADLRARDLTINALALDEDGRLYLHPQALEDFRRRVLRPASPTALHDDAARIFRTARFAAQLPHFSVHEQFFQQALAVRAAGLHTALPAERVGREVLKALASPRPGRFLDVLAQAGMLSPWLGELEGADAIPAGPVPWHRGSVLSHTCRIMDTVAGDPLAVWMALCHDVGKMLTPGEMLPHHYGHEKSGVPLAEALGLRLALPARYVKAGMVAVREHMKGGRYAELRPGTRRDLLYRVRSRRFEIPFWKLADADSGKPVSVLAGNDWARIAHVTLPEDMRDCGQRSAEYLRMLQCQQLSHNVKITI